MRQIVALKKFVEKYQPLVYEEKNAKRLDL